MRLRTLLIIILIINFLYGCAAIRTCGDWADVSLGKNFDISKKPKGVIHFDSELLSKILTQQTLK